MRKLLMQTHEEQHSNVPVEREAPSQTDRFVVLSLITVT